MAIRTFADGSTLNTSTGQTTPSTVSAKPTTTSSGSSSGYITNSVGQTISPSDPNYKIYEKQATSKPVASSVLNNPNTTVGMVINNPTPKTEIKSPAFTEIKPPSGLEVTTPNVPDTTQQPSNLSKLQSDYLNSLLPTTEENNLKTQLNTLNTSTELGVQGMNAQGRGIPLGLVRGQQSRLQQQAGIQSTSLQGQLALEQANRVARQTALNAQVGWETQREAQDRAYAETRAAEDREYQRKQESEKAAIVAAQTEFTQTMQTNSFRKLSPSEYTNLVQVLKVTNNNFNEHFTKVINPVTGVDDIYLNPDTSKAVDDFILSEGQARYDGSTGAMIANNPKVESKVVGEEIYQYDSKSGQWVNTTSESGVSKEDIARVETLKTKIELVDEILNSPYLDQVVGLKNPLTYWTPGSNEQIVKNKLEQLKQSLSLENRQQLKGSGAISDFEAKMLEKASSSLGSNLSNEDAKTVLKEIKNAFELAKLKIEGPAKLEDINDEEMKILKLEFPDLTEEQIRSSVFNKVGGDTNKATVEKVSTISDGVTGGQCGAFVNRVTGLGVGDSYASKMAKMDPNIREIKPGMVFLTPYSNTGHVGIVVGINGNNAIVKDSNWGLDEKVKTHEIPINKITGLANV